MPFEAKVSPRRAKVAGRLYLTDAHRVNSNIENRGRKGRSARIQLRRASHDASRQTEVPQHNLGGQ
jgi:hypothetical protein